MALWCKVELETLLKIEKICSQQIRFLLSASQFEREMTGNGKSRRLSIVTNNFALNRSFGITLCNAT